MKTPNKTVIGIACLSLLVGFGCSSASAGGTVSGTATYRERMALPPDAVLEVKLQDVSLADAPAVELGSARIDPRLQPR